MDGTFSKKITSFSVMPLMNLRRVLEKVINKKQNQVALHRASLALLASLNCRLSTMYTVDNGEMNHIFSLFIFKS